MKPIFIISTTQSAPIVVHAGEMLQRLVHSNTSTALGAGREYQNPKYSFVFRLVFAAMLCVRCTTSPDMAGGSGAGNPGVTAAVSIVADTVDVSAALEKASGQSEAEGGSRMLPLADDSECILNVESARFVVYRIHFILDDSEDCETRIDSFGTHLSCDSQSIVLRGPFVFDAIRGDADSPFDALRLPAARYKGMKLIIGCEGDADSSPCSPVVMKGSFSYRDTIRTFSFSVPFHSMLLYKYLGQPIPCNPADTALFRVTLDARRWLAGMDIAGNLDSGFIALDSVGNLVFDSSAQIPTAAQSIINRIGDNLKASLSGAKFTMLKKQQ